MDTARVVLRQQNSKKETPLHTALLYAPQTNILLQMLDDGLQLHTANIDDALILQDSNRKSALHCALRVLSDKIGERMEEEAWFSICKMLVDTKHKVLLTVDEYGDTPFHTAVGLGLVKHADGSGKFEKADWNWLIGPHSHLLYTKNLRGRTPLHIWIPISSYKKNMPSCLLDEKRRVLLEKDELGWTPLYTALVAGFVDMDVIEELVDTTQSVLTKPDKCGSLPVHGAMLLGPKCTLALVVFLFGNTLDADIMGHVRTDGQTVLHYALERRVDISIVRFLLLMTRTPLSRSNALLAQDRDGETALHIALRYEAPFAVIQLLVDSNKNVLTVEGLSGVIPLQVAFMHGFFFPEAKFLVDDSHRAILVRDTLNRTALHLALQYTPKTAYHNLLVDIDTLIDKDKAVLSQRVKSSKNTPLHIALKQIPHNLYISDISHIVKLIQDDKSTLTLRNRESRTPLHLALARLARDVDMRCLELLRALIDDNRKVLSLKNSKDQTPLQQFKHRIEDRGLYNPVVSAAIRALLEVPGIV